MNIVENNKLIAEFMGGKYKNTSIMYLDKNEIWLPNEGICRYDTLELGKGKLLHYNDAWNWLIPVVEKIENLPYISQFDITKTRVYIAFKLKYDRDSIIQEYQGKPKIEAAYKAVVEFIKWYNQNK
jgi:hypothetical protein